MEQKQTAVEWLESKMPTAFKELTINKGLFAQAKEMEKQQIMDAYDDGHSDGYLIARDMEEIVKYTNSEKYYNEEYGK